MWGCGGVCVCVCLLGFQDFLNFLLCKLLLYFIRVELYVQTWISSKKFQLIKKKKQIQKQANKEKLNLEFFLNNFGINPSLLQGTKVVPDSGICSRTFKCCRLCIDLKCQKNGIVRWKSLNRTFYTEMGDQVIHNRVYLILFEYYLVNDYAK